MGRMKEIYMQIMHANNGIPEEMTIEDFLKMRDLNIYHWKEYERAQERARLQLNQQANLGETTKDSEREPSRGEEIY
jgi:hypothetical protein